MRPTRRAFLGDICTTGLAVAFGSFLTRLSVAGTAHRIAGYGPLSPVADETTGLPLLALPNGFRYRSYGWTQDPLADGTPTPGVHDGMGIVSADEGVLTMVRNHEISEPCGPFGRHSQPYDRRARWWLCHTSLQRRHGRVDGQPCEPDGDRQELCRGRDTMGHVADLRRNRGGTGGW